MTTKVQDEIGLLFDNFVATKDPTDLLKTVSILVGNLEKDMEEMKKNGEKLKVEIISKNRTAAKLKKNQPTAISTLRRTSKASHLLEVQSTLGPPHVTIISLAPSKAKQRRT